jgi:hypothetical protein
MKIAKTGIKITKTEKYAQIIKNSKICKNSNELKLLNIKLKATCEQKQIKTNIKRCSKNRAESILKTENKTS